MLADHSIGLPGGLRIADRLPTGRMDGGGAGTAIAVWSRRRRKSAIVPQFMLERTVWLPCGLTNGSVGGAIIAPSTNSTSGLETSELEEVRRIDDCL